MTKIERVQAFRAPDGQLYATREDCRQAVLTSIVQDMLANFQEYDMQGVTDFICRNLAAINVEVGKVMANA